MIGNISRRVLSIGPCTGIYALELSWSMCVMHFPLQIVTSIRKLSAEHDVHITHTRLHGKCQHTLLELHEATAVAYQSAAMQTNIWILPNTRYTWQTAQSQLYDGFIHGATPISQPLWPSQPPSFLHLLSSPSCLTCMLGCTVPKLFQQFFTLSQTYPLVDSWYPYIITVFRKSTS